MAQAFYNKWRPQQWDALIGQEHVVQTLRNAVAGGRTAHAYLFAGPRGTGKTSAARLLAKAVNCLHPDKTRRPCNECDFCRAVSAGRFLDLIEIDAASNTSVEDVRDLRDKINFAPTQGQYKVYLIDEVHMLSTAAFNALLKTLEEPPPHAIFILATTEIHKIPATVLSRCQRYEFRRIPVTDIVRHLKMICTDEQLSADEQALTVIARQSTGSLRDAISLLDQLASMGKHIDLDLAQSVLGTTTSQVVVDMVSNLLERQPARGLELIHSALDEGTDPRQFSRQIVDYLRNLLLMKMNNADEIDASGEVKAVMGPQARAFEMPWLLETIQAFNTAISDPGSNWHPGLAIELAFARSIEPRVPAPSADYQPAQSVPAYQPVMAAQSVSRPASTAASAPAPVQTRASQAAPAEPARPESARSEPSPSTAPTTAAAEPDTKGEAGISMQGLSNNWRKIREVVRKRKTQTEALLNSSKPMGIKGSMLILGFNGEVIRSKMEIPENLEIVRQAIREVMGADLQISCVLSTRKGNELPSNVDVESDGMVGTALRDLGGEIVDIK